MNNKYSILSGMYRYTLLFMEDKPSIEQIKNTLTTTNPHTVIPGSKLIVKKALKDNFGINDKESMLETIFQLSQSAWKGGIIFGSLIELFLQNTAVFADMQEEQVQGFLEQEGRLSGYINKFSPLWDKVELIECLTPHYDEFKEAILNYFSKEDRGELLFLAELFKEDEAWLKYTNGLAMSGFDFSRIISILCDSHVSGYITDQEAGELLNLYGGATEALFQNWETFLFSAVLGKQHMSSSNGRFIINTQEYVSQCYKLAAHPQNLLEISGIWQGSNTELFTKYISAQYKLSLSEKETGLGKSDPNFAFVQSVVLPVFENFDVDYLLDYDMAEPDYVVPVADQNSLAFGEMEHYIKKLKLPLEADEIPFMVSSKALLTNKYIRVVEKKLFSKNVHQFSWSEKPKFTCTLTKLYNIALMVNDITLFVIPGNYRRVNISKMEHSFLGKDEVLEYYSEDIKNAPLALTELGKVLGSK